MELLLLLWLLFHKQSHQPYSRDEWLRSHGLTHVADAEARRRRDRRGALLFFLIVLVAVTLAITWLGHTRHEVPAGAATWRAEQDVRDHSCSAWTLKVLRQKAANQEQAKEASMGEMNAMVATYSHMLEGQQKACAR
jgi:hypothetical protein